MAIPEHDRVTRNASRAGALLILACALLWGCATQPSPTADGSTTRLGGASDGAPDSFAAPSAGEQPSPLGRDWIFTQVDGFDGTLPSPPPVAGFIMTREGRRLTGTTACNRMGSAYELDPSVGRLRFVDLRNTRMLCDRIAADAEEAVLEAMIITDAYRIVDGQLELLSKGKVVARLISP